MKPINRYIDHTLLKSTATKSDVETLCKEALKYNFYSVCINSCHVATANSILHDSDVSVCSVIGFPLGAMDSKAKVFEAKRAIENGATEIDMVLNIGWLKEGFYDTVENDISEVKKAIGNNILKVIFEISELTRDEIIKACQICVNAKVDFVKTSTGFSSSGATLETTKLMIDTVNNKAKVKASGGIRNYQTAKQYIDIGVDRLGVSSGIAIMEGTESNSDY